MVHPRMGAIVAVLAAASLGGWWLGSSRPAPATAFIVDRVIDGDTIDVRDIGARSGTERVRLLGVDTPEIHAPNKPVQCFGPEAASFTTGELTGREVRLELDRERRDKYGRLLAYVIVDGVRFNDELLRRGYARLLVIPPNGKYGRVMLDEELAARRARRGLWSAC